MNRLYSIWLAAVLLRTSVFSQAASVGAKTGPATAIVLLSGLAVGAAVASEDGLVALPARVLVAFGGWLGWSLGVHLLLKLTPGNQASLDLSKTMRVVGIAHAPLLFRALGLIARSDILVALAAIGWQAASVAVGVRALDPERNVMYSASAVAAGLIGGMAASAVVGFLIL